MSEYTESAQSVVDDAKRLKDFTDAAKTQYTPRNSPAKENLPAFMDRVADEANALFDAIQTGGLLGGVYATYSSFSVALPGLDDGYYEITDDEAYRAANGVDAFLAPITTRRTVTAAAVSGTTVDPASAYKISLGAYTGGGFFLIRNSLPASLTRNATDAGRFAALEPASVVSMGGLLYRVDPFATGTLSATYDLGIAGLVPSGGASIRHFGAAMDGTTDDVAAINRAIAYAAQDPATAYKKRPDTSVLDFEGAVVRISGPILMRTGVYLKDVNIRALNAMACMVTTQNYAAFLAAVIAETSTNALQEYFTGFLGECTVSANGLNMTDGLVVALAMDWFTIERLTITGYDESHNVLAAVKGCHIVGAHPSDQPKNYFAESTVDFLKVARCFQGLDIDVPDAVFRTIVMQSCPDYGYKQKKGSSVLHAHVYGCSALIWSAVPGSPRGYGVFFEGGFVAPLANAFLIAETCDYGIVFGSAVSNMRNSPLQLYVFDNRKADVTTVPGFTGAIPFSFKISNGSVSSGYPRSQGIFIPTGAYFSGGVIELSNYRRSLNFEIQNGKVEGTASTTSSTSDGTDLGTVLIPQIKAGWSKIDLTLTPPFDSVGQNNFIVSGTSGQWDLVTQSNGSSGNPNIMFGEAAVNSLVNGKVSLRGAFTYQTSNFGAGTTISSGSGGQDNGSNNPLTIVNGAANMSAQGNYGLDNNYTLLPETGTTDDLDTLRITVPISGFSGIVRTLRTSNDGDVITIRHGTGNILLTNGIDCALSNRAHLLAVQWVPALGKYCEVYRSQPPLT